MKIPASLYEAARVDGANAIHEFFTVTLPGLRYELQVVLVLTVIGTLGTFDEIYVMTGGGPGTATTVPAYLDLAPHVPDEPGRIGRGARHRVDADHLRGHLGPEPPDGTGRRHVSTTTTSRTQVT